jgi:hypothetical protein
MPAFIASTSKASTDSGFSVTTDAIDTSGANLIYWAISRYSAGIIDTFTDSKGNTWTLHGTATTPGGAEILHYYCIDPLTGSGHTFNVTSEVGSPTFPTVGILAFSGASGGVLDYGEIEINSGTSAPIGSVTPASDNAVLVSAVSLLSSVSGVGIAGGSLALEDFHNWVSTHSMGIATAYEIQGAASAVSATWSWTGTTSAAAGVVVFAEGTSPVTATSIFGEDCTVEGLSRVHALNLDGVTRTHSNAALQGSVVLGGNLTLIEQASAPVGIANAARLYAIDVAGKTSLRVIFGTGAAQEIEVEP